MPLFLGHTVTLRILKSTSKSTEQLNSIVVAKGCEVNSKINASKKTLWRASKQLTLLQLALIETLYEAKTPTKKRFVCIWPF